jgi:large subunit ribosomal protein L29
MKAKRDELNRKYMEFRFQKIIGHMDNPLIIRTMRRQISRINMLIHKQETVSAK